MLALHDVGFLVIGRSPGTIVVTVIEAVVAVVAAVVVAAGKR
jgi:hypothetical protein